MQATAADTEFFNKNGRRNLTSEYRVFDKEDLDYYYIKDASFDFDTIVENYRAVNYLGFDLDGAKFKQQCLELKAKFSNEPAFRGLFNGVHVPFVVPKLTQGDELSKNLIEKVLPALEASQKRHYPSARFKAIMQGGSTLSENLRVSENSRYQEFITEATKSPLVGWYFPQALQQFDIESQKRQMEELPKMPGVCLSGPAEIISANIAKPDLLINEDGYSPILCMSAVEHTDERLALILKAYGPHLEFWCLSQMLVPGVKQVSEQWTGGITLYCRAAS